MSIHGKYRDIEHFLKANNLIRGHDSMRFYYDFIFDMIISEVDLGGLFTPKLNVVYSSGRKCQALPFGGRNHIIYDQYLGQTFNKLTRVFFNSTSSFDAYLYGLKILTEILRIRGRLDLALFTAVAYSMTAWSGIEKDFTGQITAFADSEDTLDPSVRKLVVLIQECFVILHELIHFRLDNDLDRTAKINFVRSDFTDYLDKFSHENFGKEYTDAILSDSLGATRGGSTKENHVLHHIEKLKTPFHERFNHDWKLFLDSAKAAIKEREFAEEIVCDTSAVFSTIEIMEKNFHIPPISTLEAIQLAFENLRVLDRLKLYAEDLVRKRVTEPSIESQFFSTIRLDYFRFSSKKYIYSTRDLCKSNMSDIHDMFVRTNMKYAKLIGDTIDSLMRLKVDRMIRDCSTFLRTLEVLNDDSISPEKINQEIDRHLRLDPLTEFLNSRINI
jgi:hypothetical protein